MAFRQLIRRPQWVIVATLAACGGGSGLLPSYIDLQPGPVQGPQRFDQIAAGHVHNCGVTGTNAAWCWGSNEHGQLGAATTEKCQDGAVDCSSAPQPVSGATDYAALALSRIFTCGLTTDGRARCWGFGVGGQLGDGLNRSSTVPVDVAGGHVFVQLAASRYWYWACGLKADGALWCWGPDFKGGTDPSAGVPQRWTAAETVDFASVTMGEAHACGLDRAGRAWCLGRNGFGELGNGRSAASSSVPTPVSGAHVYQSISAGPMHTCGLDVGGQAWCWGEGGAAGDGGDGTAIRRTPVAVAGGHRFVTLRAGQQRTCGLTAAGQAWCWGQNLSGRLGDGTREARATPVQVVGGLAFQSIEAGGVATCALAPDGQGHCWGDNTLGALGRPLVLR